MKTVKTTSKTSKTIAKPTAKTTPAKAAPATKTSAKANGKAPVATTARKQGVKATTSKAPATPAVAPRREITTELIATRAYILWEQQGCPQGHDVANWLLAERQLMNEQSFTA